MKLRCNETNIKIDEFKLCIFIFMVCGILGFFIEETYDTLVNLKLDKNGFLYGLFLPIYGWGALSIHFISKKTKDKPFLSFILITIFSAIFEYLTGAIIFKIWNKRFWDYSNYFMNLDGYICLFSTMSFGFLGMLYIYIIEPFIKKIFNKIENNKLELYIKIFLLIFLIDNIFSFLIKNKF
jgi:uncharacterized membrane protein